MKKICILVLAMVFSTTLTTAQKTEKELKNHVKENASKQARQEAKSLTKQGWKTNPGAYPLDKLLEDSWMKQYQTDENGQPAYYTADGNGVAETKSVAEAQAIEMAKLQLAGLIESNIASIVKTNIANTQEASQDATSVNELVQSSKNIIAQQLGYVNPGFKIYRDLDNKKIEVQVRVFYEANQSLAIAKKAIRKELKEKLNKSDEQVDKLLQDVSK